MGLTDFIPFMGGGSLNHDVAQLRNSLPALGKARKQFARFVVRPLSSDSPAKMAAAGGRLARRVGITDQALRRSLTTLKLCYTVLWGRVRIAEEDAMAASPDEPDDAFDAGFDDDDPLPDGSFDPLGSLLAATKQHMELLDEIDGQTFEGRSSDGSVGARIDSDLKLVDLDVDPKRLGDPAYTASLIEAVNAAFTPLHRRKNALGGVIQEAVAREEEAEAASEPHDEENSGPFSKTIAEIIETFETLQDLGLELGGLCERLSGGDDVASLADEASEIVRATKEAESTLRQHIAPLKRFRARLVDKISLDTSTERDLEEVAAATVLFLEEGLDDVSLFVTEPAGVEVARELMETVATELRQKAQAAGMAEGFKSAAAIQRRQVAAVERQIFEARSEDGSVTARADGRVQLVDLELDAGRLRASRSPKAPVIEAVNTVLGTADHRWSCAHIIVPSG